ncbi:response regulator [Paenibacillus sp. WLX1005]|uniref:response regulator n=1 Tax=Paenibacillus sp. WLX1005 TaxID=3243766 RepID=UPI0039841EC3
MEYMTLLIADDEPVILRGLKKLLPWEEMGLSIIGEANDGEELRQQIVRLQPQLVISDISMPGSSGIEIMRELQAQGSRIPVIFISAFQEFDYARDAVKLGALDYLVKPIDKNQLEQVVRRAIGIIREQCNEELTQERLSYYEQKSRLDATEKLVNGLLDGDRRALPSLLETEALNNTVPVTVCVLEVEEQIHHERWEEQERNLVQFAIANIIRENLQQHEQLECGLLVFKEDRFVILIQHTDEDTPRECMHLLQANIAEYLKIEMGCAIGQTCAELSLAAVSYQSALEALKRKYFARTGSVIEYDIAVDDEQMMTDSIVISSLPDLHTELIRAWTALEPMRMEQLLEQLFMCIRREAKSQRYTAVTSTYNSILTLNRELLQRGGGIEQDHTNSDWLSRLDACATYEQLTYEACHILRSLLQQSSNKSGGKELTLLTETKLYIEQHYNDNITLETVAARVYMNPYYFSSFFKKHTGQNFKNYVTDIRMKHALKLLLETDNLVYEIAELVGYNNVRHFSDMFKKQYGRVPQEYRQACKS